MITAAQAASASTTGSTAAAVIVVIVIGFVWAYANPRRKDAKGTMTGRLVAVVLFMAVCWVLLAVTNPPAGMKLASGTATGITTLLGAIASLLHSA